MRVEFDSFWYDHVYAGVAYFFQWKGAPRSTILVVFNGVEVTHVEIRTFGDLLLQEIEAGPIIEEVRRAFQKVSCF